MNKYQVVLNWFVDLLRRDVVAKQNAKILQELVDKETPMKLLKSQFDGYRECGNCYGGYLERTFNFCHQCGQKLDWDSGDE